MKTYCISDIHGHFKNFKRFVDTLNDDDIVYVLGDVIDKGEEPIKVLKYIMHDKRFKMILGNHEFMMFELLSTEKDLFKKSSLYSRWVDFNFGGDTLSQYEKLEPFEQIEIFSYIRDLPLCYPNVVVNNRKFHLVHSCPVNDSQFKMGDLNYDDRKIHPYIWERVNPFDRLNVENCIVVAGHTPVQTYIGEEELVRPVYDYKIKKGGSVGNIENAHYIDIDGGLATWLPNARLIALCLDDLSYKLY